MGFPSYLEDIKSRIDEFQNIIEGHNKSSDKKIDVQIIFEIRRKVEELHTKLQPYFNRNFDLIKHAELRQRNNDLNKRLQLVENQNELLKKELEELKKLKKQSDRYLREESNLRESHKNIENDLSAILLDNNRIFSELQSLTASVNWYNDKDNIKILGTLINKGLKI